MCDIIQTFPIPGSWKQPLEEDGWKDSQKDAPTR